MWRRVLYCVCAAAAVPLLSGSIVVGTVPINAMKVGGVKVDGRWRASAPTVQSEDGEYLAYAADGGTPRVYFTKKKGPHTAWTFGKPERFERDEGLTEPGVATVVKGYDLTLQASEGPFKGWYLSRAKNGDLVLVEKADRAAVVKFELQGVKVRSK